MTTAHTVSFNLGDCAGCASPEKVAPKRQRDALMIYDFGDAEALRLMKAFHQIDDALTRRIVLAIAEAAAMGAELNLVKKAEAHSPTGRQS